MTTNLATQLSQAETDATQATLRRGRNILQLEGEALLQLSKTLDERFVEAVRCIHETRDAGKAVIVTGMGKAGTIGEKVSASLASIGIRSFYLHPGEAVHGDLGRVTEGDLLLVFSYSGRTEEVVRILPPLKSIGARLIAITSSEESPLGTHSDIVLPLGSLTEACPMRLAPTTSTTAMLGIGDALSMTVLEESDFREKHYRFLHSGGNLGQGLLPVRDLMRTGDEHCIVSQDASVRAVVQRILEGENRASSASIVNEEGILVGVFTDGDLRRHIAKGSDFLDRPVHEVMGKNPKVVFVEAFASEALTVLTHHKIDQVIVIDREQHPVGFIDIQDMMIARGG